MKKPKVTVIIPVYNSEKYIGRCLESILNQSLQDFEILVINDGSSDKTGEILKKYAKKYPEKIRYVEQENMGVAKTRNKAVKLAKGEFIAFIDNDDFIDRDYLEKLLPKNGEDVVISGFKRPNINKKVISKMKLENTLWSKFMNPTPWAKIYRKDFILDNKLDFLDNNIGEDIYFNLIAMLITKKIKIMQYVGYNWYFNEKSISSTEHKNFEKVDIMKLLNCCYNELKKRNLIKNNYTLLEFFFYRFIIWFLLYSVKKQSKLDIDNIYNNLFDWLSERFPDYKNNKMLRGRLPGEEKSTRLAYKIFNFFNKMGLGKSIINIWSKV